MAVREKIMRFHLIISKLRRKPATLKEIQEYLSEQSIVEECDFNVSPRTFQRDIKLIRSIYNFDIQHNQLKGGYYIEDDETALSDHILKAFDTFNALNLAERLSPYIHFETRKPAGTENLSEILHAIQNKIQIKFTYHKYWEDQHAERLVDPYALKEFRSRWYVLARDPQHNIVKSFALDRLSELKITRDKFEVDPNFNIDEHYNYCFGIVGPTGASGEEPEEVVLSFTPFQGKYIKSFPLHHTQKELVDDDKEFRVKLKVFITEDFILELLSFTKNLKILQPPSLAKEIKRILQSGVAKYQ